MISSILHSHGQGQLFIVCQSWKINGNPQSRTLEATLKSCLASLFVCVEVLRPSQTNGVMWSAVSLPNHTFTGQA